VRLYTAQGGDEEAWRDCNGTFLLDATTSGWQLVEIAPADPSLRLRLVPLVLPELLEPATLDLGELQLQTGAQLRLVDAAGTPLRAATAAFGRAGWQYAREWREWPLDEGGAWCGPDLRAGDGLLVQREGCVPLRSVLQGDGPWIITAPAGQLDLAIADDAGSPLAATLVVADEDVEAAGGSAHLRGLPAGPTRIWVSAVGHRSAVVDAVVTSAPQAVQVILPPR